jgi:hypothetical protein
MSKASLRIIADAMREMGLAYDFMEYKGEFVYPYFVGEYTEQAPTTEDGLQITNFMLTGFSHESWAALEDAREQIAQYFGMVSGKTVIADNGSGVAVFYENALVVPTEDATLKRIQINLHIKEWKVTA